MFLYNALSILYMNVYNAHLQNRFGVYAVLYLLVPKYDCLKVVLDLLELSSFIF